VQEAEGGRRDDGPDYKVLARRPEPKLDAGVEHDAAVSTPEETP
jgi:hypothetical protein